MCYDLQFRFLEETTKLVKHQNGRITAQQIIMYLEVVIAGIKDRMNEVHLDHDTIVRSIKEVGHHITSVISNSKTVNVKDAHDSIDRMKLAKIMLKALVNEFRDSQNDEATRAADEMGKICHFIDEFNKNVQSVLKTIPKAPTITAGYAQQYLKILDDAKSKMKEIGTWAEKHTPPPAA